MALQSYNPTDLDDDMLPDPSMLMNPFGGANAFSNGG